MIDPHREPEAAVADAMDPFDEALRVPPYREHFSHDSVKHMAKCYGVRPAELHTLAAKMEDWCGCPGGVDRIGLYALRTCNPDGRWDWYEIGGRWDGYIPTAADNVIDAQSLAGAPLRRCLPYAVLTPEGQWLEHERIYVSGDLKRFKVERHSNKAWLNVVRKTLLQWPLYQVVCVDVHC